MALALVVAGVMTLALTWDMTFFQDTWAFLIERRAVTADTVLAPHNEHIVVLPVLIEQLFLRLFGMDSAKPEYLLLTIGLLGNAVLLFTYVGRRVGDWLALYAVLLVLFLGPAFEVLLWPFEIVFVGSVFFGLAALLALEREDRFGDLAACVFLVAALGFSSLGIPFVIGAATSILVGPKDRWVSRAYAVAIPALLFAAWYAGWGSAAESQVSLKNALSSPGYIADSIAANIGSALGLGASPNDGVVEPSWGRAIAVALVVVLGIWQGRRGRLSARLWPVAAVAFSNWFLAALNQFPGREPTTGRYQYAGVILLLLVLASLFDGARPSRWAVGVAGIATVLAIGPNLVVLKNGANYLDEQSVLTRADTAAIEIAHETVDPGFQLVPDIAGTPSLPNVYADSYLRAVEEYGSPAYTPAELEAAPEAGRYQADVVLANALPISKETEVGGFTSSADSDCTVLPPGPKGEVALSPGTTRIEVAPGPEAGIKLRRFAAGQYPVQTEAAPGGSASELTIPADTVARPWHLLVEADQMVRVCR